MIHCFDYLFLLRPTLWVVGWTFFLLGFYRGRLSVIGYRLSVITVHRIPITEFFVATLVMSGIYVLNQIIDIESDRANKKLYLLSEGYIKVSHAWIEFATLFALAVILSIPFSKEFKIILLLSMLFGILYSVPPFKFKGRPILDILSNSFGYGVIAFSLGWVSGSPLSKNTLLHALPYFFAVAAVFTNSTIPDIEGDKLTNELTTGVFLGARNTYWLSTAFILSSFGLSVWLNDWICGLASACSIPLFTLAAIKHNLKTCFISMRAGPLILALLVGLKFWWFIPLFILVFLGLRTYYKFRFNIVYPKFV